jgi:multicomponent Na+:H+ antiporter subunit B
VSMRTRKVVFLAAVAVFGFLLIWGLSGLPAFGDYRGPYGFVLGDVAVEERVATNVVVSTTFDYRGFDTMGEEYILFAAVLGLVILLRDLRSERIEEEEEEEEESPVHRRRREASDALRVLGLVLVGPLVMFGIYIVVHGALTPGGGFQGGVILAAALILVSLAGRYPAMRRVRPIPLVEVADGAGAAGYVLIGLGGLIAGVEFLYNFLPLGETGTLLSAGMIPLLSISVGLEVAGAFVLLISEFLDQEFVTGPGEE